MRKIPHCCLPKESGPCLSPNVAGHSLKPATDRGLGEPLPPQLANRTQAHPQGESFHLSTYEVLANVSVSCPYFLGVGTHALRTRSPLRLVPPFDLHVSGMPPAFILSQDQTLLYYTYTRALEIFKRKFPSEVPVLKSTEKD